MALLVTTLAIGICGGCISVFVDIDHVIAHKFHKDHRFLHKYYFIASIVVIVCCGAYIGGLYL